MQFLLWPELMGFFGFLFSQPVYESRPLLILRIGSSRTLDTEEAESG